LPHHNSREWVEFKKLLQRPWSRRLWVVQDALLSVSPYIMCGKKIVAWEDFIVWCTTKQLSGSQAWLKRGSEKSAVPPILMLTCQSIGTITNLM
ncbi:hypothetical protein CC78DRAFT_476372, partial [Lojkania enalia]